MDQTTKSDPAADLQADSDFRQQVRDWMTDHLRGEFAPLRFRGGPADEHALVPERMAWEREISVIWIPDDAPHEPVALAPSSMRSDG